MVISIKKAKDADGVLKELGAKNTPLNTSVLMCRLSLKKVIELEKDIIDCIIDKYAERDASGKVVSSNGGVSFGANAKEADKEYIEAINIESEYPVHKIPKDDLLAVMNNGDITANAVYILIDAGIAS